MLQSFLNLDGVAVLDKRQQANVNGGEKCAYVSGWSPGDSIGNGQFFENDGEGSNTYNGGNVALTCKIRCRPTFLGIGIGQWGDVQEVPCRP